MGSLTKPANQVLAQNHPLGVLKEVADALKLAFFNSDFAVVADGENYVLVTTAPASAMSIIMWSSFVNGWLTRYFTA